MVKWALKRFTTTIATTPGNVRHWIVLAILLFGIAYKVYILYHIGYDIAEEPSIAQTQNKKKLYYIIRLKMQKVSVKRVVVNCNLDRFIVYLNSIFSQIHTVFTTHRNTLDWWILLWKFSGHQYLDETSKLRFIMRAGWYWIRYAYCSSFELYSIIYSVYSLLFSDNNNSLRFIWPNGYNVFDKWKRFICWVNYWETHFIP